MSLEWYFSKERNVGVKLPGDAPLESFANRVRTGAAIALVSIKTSVFLCHLALIQLLSTKHFHNGAALLSGLAKFLHDERKQIWKGQNGIDKSHCQLLALQMIASGILQLNVRESLKVKGQVQHPVYANFAVTDNTKGKTPTFMHESDDLWRYINTM